MGIISNKVYTPELDIKQLTAPSVQPVSLAEQKLYSRIDGTDEDSLITELIAVATLQCEDFVRGGFIKRTWSQSEDAGENLFASGVPFGWTRLNNGAMAIEIKNLMVSSIESLKFYNIDDVETVINSSLYRLDRANSWAPARVVFDIGATIGDNTREYTQYILSYTAGIELAANVPVDIKQAIKVTAHNWYENRETMGSIPDSAKKILNGKYRIIEL